MEIIKTAATVTVLFVSVVAGANASEGNGLPGNATITEDKYSYDYGDTSYIIIDGVEYKLGQLSATKKEDQTNHEYANSHRASGCNYIVINGAVFQLVFDGYEGFVPKDSVDKGSNRKRHDLKCIESSSSIKASK